MNRAVGLREKVAVVDQNQGVFRSGQCDIKQPLHFLTLGEFQFFLEFIRVRFVENDLRLVAPWGLDQARVARAGDPRLCG